MRIRSLLPCWARDARGRAENVAPTVVAVAEEGGGGGGEADVIDQLNRQAGLRDRGQGVGGPGAAGGTQDQAAAGNRR